MGIDNSLFLGYTVAFRCTFTTCEVKTMEWIVAIFMFALFAYANIAADKEVPTSEQKLAQFRIIQVLAIVMNLDAMVTILIAARMGYDGQIFTNYGPEAQLFIFILLFALVLYCLWECAKRLYSARTPIVEPVLEGEIPGNVPPVNRDLTKK